MEAFPSQEPEFATVAVTTRGNYSPVEVREILIEVEQEVINVAGIQDMVLNFGSAGAVGNVPPDTIGNLQLQFEPYKDRRKAEEIFNEIRDRIKKISGVGVSLVEAENGPPAGNDISLRVESTTYNALTPTVAKVRNFVENELGDTNDVEDGRSLPGIDWKIGVDRDMAARFGIGVRELSPYVQLITGGVEIGSYRPDDAVDEIDIRVRLPKEQRSFEALDSMRIATPDGLVPVSTFITREPVRKVADIQRWDGKYYMNVRGNVVEAEGVTVAGKVGELKEWVNAQTWPSGVDFVFGGAEEQTQETNAFLIQAGVGALFLMFLILLTQFNSFYQVFVTLSTVIMAVGGVLLGMAITGQKFSAIMTGVGIVALAGIVVNNSIVLIDTYNRFRREKKIPAEQAILMTAAQRIRPVLLTTITTVFGLIPMALSINVDFFSRTVELDSVSGSIWIQLSTALVSGLTFSTLLTLILVPVMLSAPTRIWASIKRLGQADLFANIRRGWSGNLTAADAAGATAKIPAGINSAQRYIDDDQTGLVEIKRNGVTVVSRQAAE
jgi:multidrug efflux pump